MKTLRTEDHGQAGVEPTPAATRSVPQPSQLYPAGSDLGPEFLVGPRDPWLSRRTPVASIGSCFAREFKEHLIRRGFNYLSAENGRDARGKPLSWNMVYNTFSLRQEFERALGTFAPRERSWPVGGQLLDPYRKWVVWPSPEQRDAELERFRLSARAAFTAAEVLIMTVGLSEIWYSRVDGTVYSQLPPEEVFDPALHAFRSTTVAENLENLEAIHRMLGETNPGCRLIVTVSPVPLRATFEPRNVIVSNSISKAKLVVAVHEFVARHDDVRYFPAYELVSVGIRNALERDNRHVRPRAVRRIMDVFERMFVAA